MGGNTIMNAQTQNLIICVLGIIGLASIITISLIPYGFESIILALIALASTIVGGLIGVLNNKPSDAENNPPPAEDVEI